MEGTQCPPFSSNVRAPRSTPMKTLHQGLRECVQFLQGEQLPDGYLTSLGLAAEEARDLRVRWTDMEGYPCKVELHVDAVVVRPGLNHIHEKKLVVEVCFWGTTMGAYRALAAAELQLKVASMAARLQALVEGQTFVG